MGEVENVSPGSQRSKPEDLIRYLLEGTSSKIGREFLQALVRSTEKGYLVHFPDRVIELFPYDADLSKLNAVSYAGVPFLQPDGTVLGHLSALDTKTFDVAPDVESVFRIFAARAAASSAVPSNSGPASVSEP